MAVVPRAFEMRKDFDFRDVFTTAAAATERAFELTTGVAAADATVRSREVEAGVLGVRPITSWLTCIVT